MPHILPGLGANAGQMVGSGPVFSLAYTGQGSSLTDALTTHTASNIAAGAADTDRLLLASIVAYGGSTLGATGADAVPTSVTIGGVAASELGRAVIGSGMAPYGVSVWSAYVPAGTTATVVTNFRVAMDRMGASLFRAILAAPRTPVYVVPIVTLTTTDISGWQPGAVPRGGLVGALAQDHVPVVGGLPAFSGATQVYSGLLEGGSHPAGAIMAPGTPTIGFAWSDADMGRYAVAVAF